MRISIEQKTLKQWTKYENILRQGVAYLIMLEVSASETERNSGMELVSLPTRWKRRSVSAPSTKNSRQGSKTGPRLQYLAISRQLLEIITCSVKHWASSCRSLCIFWVCIVTILEMHPNLRLAYCTNFQKRLIFLFQTWQCRIP